MSIVTISAIKADVGEVLEPFANPHYVAGWMRGSHNGPLMPRALGESTPARFDGPPRVAERLHERWEPTEEPVPASA